MRMIPKTVVSLKIQKMKEKMKKIFLILGLSFSCSLWSQNSITLGSDPSDTKIAKEIYGHFSEHLGTCIYEGIYVGEDSDIPNIDGFRTDVVQALKALKVPVLRWPGGCFADTYHWKDGIGPKEDRPSIVNVFWGGVTEDNSFGTHEFLNFCELIGTEPYLSINVGTGTVQEARDWVQYVTSDNKNPMSDLRKKNGREKPWSVKYWGIGNENWGCGGDMNPEYYSNIFRNYSSYISGEGFQKVICGPSGNDGNWTEKILATLEGKNHLAQGLSLHYYTLPNSDWQNKGSSTDFGEEMWFKTLRNTMFVEDYIRQHLAIMDEYDPDGKIKLIVDEWGTWYDKLPETKDGFLQQQNTLRDALVAGINLNIFNNHADRISMANIAQIVNVLQSVIRTKGPLMVKTPTYYIFQLYNVHQDAALIPIQLESEQYQYEGESIPAITSSASEKNGIISITLTNANPNKDIPVTYKVGKPLKSVAGKIVNSKKITDFNDFGKKEKVRTEDFSLYELNKQGIDLTLPAHSVVLIQIQTE
jgi:alpha-N-arabinofuranosidase